MNTMIQLYANYKETLEKQSMGFRMSDWDGKLLRYGERFEKELMDLGVNIPLEEGLDLCWAILNDCFESAETGIPTKLIDQFWPKKKADTPFSEGARSGTGDEAESENENVGKGE